MCGRMVMELTPELLATVFGTPKVPTLVPSYNIAPTQMVHIVRQVSDHRTLDSMKWGLVPTWAKDPAIGNQMINARSETVAEKPSFRHAIKYRRGIIPASGYYEWLHEGKAKIPYYFRMKDGSPIGFAGIWEEWKAPDSTLLQTFSLLTTKANKLVEPIHDRMPVILAPDEYPTWLNKHLTSPEQLQQLYQPYPSDLLEAYPVSERVNSPRNNSPENIQREPNLTLLSEAW
jgi:putative SOS response-associated peptidase YedK